MLPEHNTIAANFSQTIIVNVGFGQEAPSSCSGKPPQIRVQKESQLSFIGIWDSKKCKGRSPYMYDFLYILLPTLPKQIQTSDPPCTVVTATSISARSVQYCRRSSLVGSYSDTPLPLTAMRLRRHLFEPPNPTERHAAPASKPTYHVGGGCRLNPTCRHILVLSEHCKASLGASPWQTIASAALLEQPNGEPR